MKKTAARRLCWLALSSLVFLATSAKADESNKSDKSKLLTRSIYVNVRFELCEHLEAGVLYEGEQALGILPVKRIFQFTYYPNLGRIEPLRTDLRVEGLREDGERFIGKLAIAPWGIFTANRKIELDLDKQLRRLRYKLDVRYKLRKLKLACGDACGLTPALVAARAKVPESN